MKLNEAEAHKLVACLTELGIPAKVNGAGVNWKVDIAPKGGRSMSVTCFWYEPHIGTIILGMNPGNARSSLKQERKPHEGPEFCVTLISDGNHIADGRTGSQKEVLTCAISWLSGATIDMLVQEVPFIDEKRRAMKAVSVQLDPRLTWEIKGGPLMVILFIPCSNQRRNA